jgi:hypothetical protein
VDYSEMLKRIESSTAVLTSESYRAAAFDRLLQHELTNLGTNHKSRAPIARAIKTRSRAPKAGEKSVVREEVRAVHITPDTEGLPPWNVLGVLEKYLWILAAARKAKVDGLSTSEIEFLIFKIFRESHKSNRIKNLKTKIKVAFVQIASVVGSQGTVKVWRILRKGEEHLNSLVNRKEIAR